MIYKTQTEADRAYVSLSTCLPQFERLVGNLAPNVGAYIERKLAEMLVELREELRVAERYAKNFEAIKEEHDEWSR